MQKPDQNEVIFLLIPISYTTNHPRSHLNMSARTTAVCTMWQHEQYTSFLNHLSLIHLNPRIRDHRTYCTVQ